MEAYTLHGNNFQFHLRSHMDVDDVPTTALPLLHVYFNWWSSTRYFSTPFWRIVRDPIRWRQQVLGMLLAVLPGSEPFAISLLADAFCRYFDAARRRFPALHGRAMVINADIDIVPPTPRLTVDNSLWVVEQRVYNGGRGLVGPPPGFEAVLVDDVVVVSPVEDLPRGGGRSVDSPPSSSASAAFLQRVKIVTFDEAEAEKVEGDKDCSICLAEFEAGQQLHVMPCHHRFHLGCLKEWLARSHVCPLCRFDLSSRRFPVEE